MSGVRGDVRKRAQESQSAPEVGLTEAEREALDERFGDAFTVAWERAVARIKADAIQQERAVRDREFGNLRWVEGHQQGVKDGRAEERAAWVAQIEALADEHEVVMDSLVPMPNREERESGRKLVARLRALLSSDATEAGTQ